MPEDAVWAVVDPAADLAEAGPAGVEAAAAALARAPAGSASVRPAGTKCPTAKESPALRKSVRNAGR
jgi:hypothetical protein